MNCRKARSLLLLRESDDVAPRLSARLDRHVAGCASCLDYARSLVPLPLAEVRPDSPLDEADFVIIRSAVLGEIRRQPIAGRDPGLRLDWVAAVALGLFLLGVGIVLSRHPEPSPVRHARLPPAAIGPAESPLGSPEAQAGLVEPSPAQAERSTTGETSFSAPRPEPPSAPPIPARDPTPVAADPSGYPLRVELQTRDPLVRIIWITFGTTSNPTSGAAGAASTS